MSTAEYIAPQSAASLAHLPLCTPRECMQREARPLEVRPDTTMVLSADNCEVRDRLVRVKLASFADAQAMGFIPRRLTEEKIRQAIKTDDESAYRQMAAAASSGAHGCSCEGEERNDPRSRYLAIRRNNNPALAEVLSERLNSRIEWHSPLANAVRKWALDAGKYREIAVALFADIVVHRNARLLVAPQLRSLLAHNILIHRTGLIVHGGSYLRIWANSISEFTDFISENALRELNRTHAGWLLHDQ